MSELSLDSIILKRNQVQLDQSYIQKQVKNQSQRSPDFLRLSQPIRNVSSKDIKINKNFLANRKKLSSPQSSAQISSKTIFQKNKDKQSTQKLYKLGIRLDAFQQNMKRMQTRYGKQFFKLQQEIFKRKKDSNAIFEDLKKVRETLDGTKKNIGNVLNSLAQKNS